LHVAREIGVSVVFTGIISDFDKAGLFGLITADDGSLLVFNLWETPPALRGRFEVGTRVRFTRNGSEPTARAVEVTRIDQLNEDGASTAPRL
jgi:hypothetical protein